MINPFITDPIDVPPRLVDPGVIPDWVPIRPAGSQTSPISLAPRETLALASDAFERALNVSALNEPCRVLLGKDRLGAQITTALNYSNSLLVVCFWCRGPIQAIDSFTVDDKTPNAAIIATHYLGTTGQAVDAKLVIAFAAMGITHSAAFAGLCYSVFEFPVGTNLGDIHIVTRGVLPYDYRDVGQTLGVPASYVYSDNPALLLAHVISNTTYGLGGTMDWAGSVAAFSACDDMTSGEKKRVIGMAMDRRLPADQWCDILRAHAGCFIVRSQGKYKLVPDAVATSVKTFSKASKQIIDKSRRWQRTGLDQQPNVVEVAWTDTSVIPWKTAIAVYPPNGIPPGSEDLRLTRIDLSGCQRYSQAMREVHERRNHGRSEGFIFTFDAYAEALALEYGDVYTADDGGAFAGIVLRLTERRMARKGRFTLTGKKYLNASYNNSADAAPTYVDTTLPLPTDPPTVTGLALIEIIEAPGVGGQPRSSIKATWARPAWPFLAGYRVYVIDDAGALVDEGEPVGEVWSSRTFAAPQRLTVYAKAKSTIATAVGYDSEQITLSGSTTSLTLLTASKVLSAGATLLKYETYTLYPGDPYFRVAPVPTSAVDFATQFLTDPISAATPNVLSHKRFLTTQERSANYAKTAPIDLGNIKQFTVSVLGGPVPNAFYLMIGFEAADALIGPWTFANGTTVTLTGRFVRMVVAPRDDQPTFTFPDGGDSIGSAPWGNPFDEADFGQARISVFGQTVEESDVVTTSASGPVLVTLARKYAAMRDLQVSATDANGTAVVTFDSVSLSLVAANTFNVNATVAGARVAIPLRWNFKGAL